MTFLSDMSTGIEPPVIDFGLFLSGTREDQAVVARRVDDALRMYGSLYLANHGISQSIIDQAFQQVQSSPVCTLISRKARRGRKTTISSGSSLGFREFVVLITMLELVLILILLASHSEFDSVEIAESHRRRKDSTSSL